MISRRHFLQAGMAASALLGPSSLGQFSALAATQALSQNQLLDFDDFGNVTLVHITDIHAQAMPVFFREPSINIGVGAVEGLPPHITGEDFLKSFGIETGSPAAYALTSVDFTALAKTYGRMGGLDRVATVVNSIRADRDPNMLLLDGGDTWQGSYVSNQTNG
ncbi:MAG: thiosulfohydrolase SoxB, partial [Hyphomicrobiales bacterium]